MHADPDTLALLALGEDVATPDELAHVASCASCTAALNDYRGAAAAGRSSAIGVTLVQPDARVWRGIAEALSLDPALQPGRGPVGSGWSAGAVAGSGGLGGAAPDASADASDARDSVPPPMAPHADPSPKSADAPRPVVDLGGAAARAAASGARRDRSARGRVRRRWIPLAAAAAVVAFVLGGGTALAVLRPWQSPTPVGPTSSVLAQANLQALPTWPGANGRAVVVEQGSIRSIDVSLSDVTASTDTYQEVWLMNTQLTKLISVGLLSGDAGTFEIPPDVNLAEYSIVDISSEPLDGNPAHSSNSILRGALTP